MRMWLPAVCCAGVFIVASPTMLGTAFAKAGRGESECRQTWSKAVRSYLTQNRRAGPDGANPTDLDQAEQVVQAWDRAFAPACQLEAAGKRAEARVEAASIGARVLAKLDPKGCVRFMDSFMQSSSAEAVCDLAGGQDDQALRAKVAGSLPAR